MQAVRGNWCGTLLKHFVVCEKRAFLAKNLARASEHLGTHSICNQSILSSHLYSLCKCLCGLLWGVTCCFHLNFQNQCLHPEMTYLGACSDLTMEKLHSWQETRCLIGTILWSVPHIRPQKLDVFLVCFLMRTWGCCPHWTYWLLHQFWKKVSKKIHL